MNALDLIAVRSLVITWRNKPWAGLAGLLLLIGAVVFVVEAASAPEELRIASISTQGTNLVLHALVPAGMGQVAVDMRPSLDAPWAESGQWDVPAGGGDVPLIFPQPASATCFFRLRAKLPMESSQSVLSSQAMLSSELEFVTTGSLGSHTTNGNAVFHFKGRVDGSDRILITRDGALWDHVNWSWPENAVVINGTEWNPAMKNYLSTTNSMRFLPEAFSLSEATLEIIHGRGVVALERTNGAVIVYLDDTEPGADDYEFELSFPPAKPAVMDASASVSGRLKIAAQIDGSDLLRITAQAATWTHGTYALPENVTINGIAWDISQTNVLENAGTNVFLPAGIDFSTARIISRKGRDLVTAWADKDVVWVRFADNPNGSDEYEIEIAFGGSPTSPP